jgi:hypothetical protein
LHFLLNRTVLVLYLPTGNGQLTYDPDTKNPIEGKSETIEIVAMCKQRRLFFERDQRQPGTNTEEISVAGRFIKPATINRTQVQLKQPVKAIINGNPGRLLLNITIESPAIARLGLSKLVGQAFTGQMVYDP